VTDILDPQRLARWYGGVEGDLRAGGEIRLRLDGADLDSVGQIEECDAPSTFSSRPARATSPGGALVLANRWCRSTRRP